MNRLEDSAEPIAGSPQSGEENVNYEVAFREMQTRERELSQRTEMLEKMMQTLSMLLPSSPSCSTSATSPVFVSPSAPPPNPPATPTVPATYPKSYLRDVLELVPKYDGHNIPVWQFARACKRAMESVPQVDEVLFVRMLRNKLSHHAYLAVEDEVHSTVGKFLDCLKRTFGSGRNSNYYRGQLSMVYKRQNEHILDYIGRIKDLKTAIIDGDVHTLERSLTQAELASVEAFALDAFFEGLPREYRVELRAEGYSNFSDACAKIINISKRLEREEMRYGRTTRASRDDSTPRNTGRTQQANPSAVSDAPDLTGRKICSYCKKFGHLANDCYRRQSRENPGNSNSNNANTNADDSVRNNSGRANANNLAAASSGNSQQASANRESRGLANQRRTPVHCLDGAHVPSTSSAETMEPFLQSYSDRDSSPVRQPLC